MVVVVLLRDSFEVFVCVCGGMWGFGGGGGCQRIIDVLLRQSDSPIGIIVQRIRQFKYLTRRVRWSPKAFFCLRHE